ncbi:MAG: DUF58 domain-containing protein [Hyphomicrobiales bacterium]|nr:DUF58 domain-containing protein [Hyphomicrobiales bacterium]MDE2114954.1 DUF58 domain-containing protein [Hyphomicrobiales bacterium]
MVQIRAPDPTAGPPKAKHQNAGLALAARLPPLMNLARQIAASVMQGVHGRRRAGVGGTFWQFRHYSAGEAAHRIDWRRSGRDDRLYVREREWEAAHDIWLWADASPSMNFMSDLALESKGDRALILMFAIADLLVRGGERVGVLDVAPPRAARDIVERIGQELVETQPNSELPAGSALPQRARAILIGDFLSEAGEIIVTLNRLAARGARGHIIMIADPVEETFPFAGHSEFIDIDSGARLRAGKAENLQAIYQQRLMAHRERIQAHARALGWSVGVHRTDRPASQAVLALMAQITAGERE